MSLKTSDIHGVQFSQLQLLMANVKIYECLLYSFALAITVSQNCKICKSLIFTSRSIRRNAILSITPFDSKCQSIKIVSQTLLRQRLPFHKYQNSTFFTSKSMSRSRSQISAATSLDGKAKSLRMSLTHVCALTSRFRDITICNCCLQKVDQDHEVQFQQLHHSIANVKIFKGRFNLVYFR